MIQIQKRYSTADGDRIVIRLLDAGDFNNIKEIFDGMGSESRYQRFLQSVDHLSEPRVVNELQKVIEQLPQQSNGLIAFLDDKPVGAARYVRIGDQRGELAVSVVDVAQGKGIGSALLPLLTELAVEDGITVLEAMVGNNNEGMWHLLNKLPYEQSRFSEGSASLLVLNLLKERFSFTV